MAKGRIAKGINMSQATDSHSGHQEGFWAVKDPFGGTNAVRQLTNSLHKGGRKRKPLPGSKLQPLFKNHTAPPRMEHSLSHQKVLPSIGAFTDNESLIKHVMAGNTNELPSMEATTIRVFLCSNSEDMSAERAMLVKRAVPQLQEYSSEYGLHFQLVDLHWGVDGQMVNGDFNVRNIHHREITQCQKTSLGPHFVALLGDKYGSQQLVSEIPEDEFDIILEIASANNLESLLTLYYLRDTNAVPVSYRLQTIEEPEDVNKLVSIISDCVTKAYDSDKISLTRKKHFLMSTLEEDITLGITQTKDPRRHCLCYRREFQNIREHLNTPGVSSFFEVKDVNGKVELKEEKYQSLLKLSDDVSQHLGSANFRPYYIPWQTEGIQKSDQIFQNYLARMCNDFVTDMKAMIHLHAEKSIKESKKLERMILKEVLHHANLCKQKTTFFQGQSNVLFTLEKFFRDPRQSNKPFLIYGQQGSGKSTVMAKAALEFKKWFTEDCVVVYRSLGTSSNCSSIYNTTMNITLQICLAYNLPLPDVNVAFSSLYKTLVTFRETLDTVSQEHAFIRPLFIVLDGIHELQPHEESLRALWAIRDLPINVHMVISTVTQIGSVDLLSPLTQLVTDAQSIMEVEKLTEEDTRKIISDMCEKNKRELTESQKKAIRERFESSKNPLHLSVMIDHAIDWTSYDKPSEFQTNYTSAEYLSKTLDELEEQYGPMLTMALCSYITTSPVGIHERELLDLLMSDQDAEEDVERFTGAVFEGLLYFPSYVFAQFKFKLRNFLTEHSVSGRKVLAWKHKDFYAAVGEKYQVIFPGINEKQINEDATSYTLMLHENMANMYLTDNRLMTISAADPKKDKQKPQPIPLTNPQPINMHNLLMLERVPIHLRVMAPVEGLSRAKDAVLFNFNWLQTKIKARPLFICIQDVLGLYNIMQHLSQHGEGLSMDETQDIEILYEFLQLSQKALNHNPNNLAAEVLGRLDRFSDFEYLDKLLKGTKFFLDHSTEKRILPLYKCFSSPEQLLRHSMEGPSHFVGFLHKGKCAVMFSQKYGTDIWDIEKGELMHRFKVNSEQPVDKVIPGHSNEFVLVAHYSHLNHQTDLRVISSETGVNLVHANFLQNFEAMALNSADNIIVVATSLIVEQVDQKCLIAVDVQTKDILFTLPQENIHEEGVTQLLFVTLHNKDDALLTIGSKRSKDLGFWNLTSEEMQYKLDLNCFVENVKVFETTAICASAREGVLLFIDLTDGTILQRIEDTELIGLTDMILCKNGDFVLIATRHNGVNIYDAKSYRVVKTIADDQSSNQNATPYKICLDYEENFLFVGYDMGGIIVYLLHTGQDILRILGHKSKINSLNVTENLKLFSTGQDNIANMWNLENRLGSILNQLPDTQKRLLEGNDKFLKESDKGGVDFKDSDDSEYPGENDKVTSMVVTSDHVITSSMDGPIKVWSADTGKLEQTVSDGCENGVVELYLAYKDNLLIAHCIEPGLPTAYRLQVWNLQTLLISQVPMGDNPVIVYSTCLYPSADKLLTVSPVQDNKHAGMVFEIYDLFEMKKVSDLKCNIFGNMNKTNLKFIGMSKNIPRSNQSKATLDNIQSGKNSPSRVAAPGVTSSRKSAKSESSHDPDEDFNNLYAILDYFPEENVSFFFTVVISGNNQNVITMGATDPIELDTVSADCTLQLKDGNCITGTVEGELVVWNAATQRIVTTFHDQDVLVASRKAGGDNRMSVRRAHNGVITAVVGSADSKLLMSGDKEGVIKVWDMTRKLLHTLEGHNSQINTIFLGRDKEVIISGSEGDEILAHCAQTGQLLASFYAHTQILKAVITSDKSRVMAIANRYMPRLMVLKTINM